MSTREDMIAKVDELVAAPSCCEELKEAVSAWKAAVGTDAQKEKADALVEELKGDVLKLDEVLVFFKSDMATEIFGAERQKAMIAHAEERKAAGAEYCDCPACAAGLEILQASEGLYQ